MKDLSAKVVSNDKIAENIYMITLELPSTDIKFRGGQFVNLSVGDDSFPLRRPLGVCKAEKNKLSLCYQVKGGGTRRLVGVKAGEELKVLLPLGNGFGLENYKKVAVIGGGVGVFPLVATVREYIDKIDFYCFIGYRNAAAVCLAEEFEKCKSLTLVTDDGSAGEKDNAVSAYLKAADKLDVDAIIACGPPIMLKVLKQSLKEKGISTPCFVSLEERMGCGIGACLVCACKLSDGGNARVCRDGPVFNINDVEL